MNRYTTLRPWVNDLRKATWVACDTETTGLRVNTVDKPFAVGLRDYNGDMMTWEWRVDIETREPQYDQQELNDLASTLLCYDWVVFHNSLFDVAALRQIGIEVPWSRVHDTMVMAHLVDSLETKALKPLSDLHFDVSTKDEETLLVHAKFATDYAKQIGLPVDNTPKANYWLPSALKAMGVEVPGYDSCHEYLEGDIERTALLWLMFREAIMDRDLLGQYHRDMAVLPVYSAMSRRGMKLSGRVFEVLSGWEDRNRGTKERLQKRAKVKNIDSAAELREAVFGRWKLKPSTWTRGGEASVDKVAIGNLAERRTRHRQFFLSLLDYRSEKSALKYTHSYLQLAHHGVLHPGINPTGTHTTRTSSSSPNGQNVAKHSDYPTRQLFAPREGYELWAMDYDQLEIRLTAWASQDQTLIEELTRKGGDVHAKTAEIFGVPRKIAKGINFGWIYGAGKKKLSQLAGVDAQEFIDGMSSTYPGVVKFMRRQDQTAKRHGKIKTLFGTPLWIDQGKTYSATDYTIQGSAGDVMKIGLIRVWDYIERKGVDIKPLILVHDELVMEVKEETTESVMKGVKEALEYPGKILGWPLPVDAEKSSESWGAMKKVKWSKPRRKQK